MESVFFKVNGQEDVTFDGKLVAHVHDSDSDVSRAVYETPKGNWFYTESDNENVLLRSIVIENKSKEELIKILKFTDLAKVIYSQLGIETTKKLDI
ncbi:hypothetical protein [Kosakonia sp. MUSA4]|uniref:hypothetical protein n=1 Tax=Kosakonia sp. MUSA4 TaxID=2067958 RepID=UPI00159830DD|nr:hypothetical protein [Kosakonia sp. MUSA4]QJT80422.1 hypothetical protein C0557_10200 [Kosakonia sp. MUSA4]